MFNQVDNTINPPNPIQSNPTQPKICGFMNLCGLSWVKISYFFLIIQVVDSTIGELIEPNPTDYYHLIFTHKKKI